MHWLMSWVTPPHIRVMCGGRDDRSASFHAGTWRSTLLIQRSWGCSWQKVGTGGDLSGFLLREVSTTLQPCLHACMHIAAVGPHESCGKCCVQELSQEVQMMRMIRRTIFPWSRSACRPPSNPQALQLPPQHRIALAGLLPSLSRATPFQQGVQLARCRTPPWPVLNLPLLPIRAVLQWTVCIHSLLGPSPQSTTKHLIAASLTLPIHQMTTLSLVERHLQVRSMHYISWDFKCGTVGLSMWPVRSEWSTRLCWSGCLQRAPHSWWKGTELQRRDG